MLRRAGKWEGIVTDGRAEKSRWVSEEEEQEGNERKRVVEETRLDKSTEGDFILLILLQITCIHCQIIRFLKAVQYQVVK